jgi:hypothetical protein
MKCRLLSIALALTALLMVVCQEKSSNPAQTVQSEAIGHWYGKLIPVLGTPEDTVLINAIIRSDETFNLSTTYATSGDTTLRYAGAWTQSNDTIHLAGSNCAIMDTTLDSLLPVACVPVAIPIDITNDVWIISVKDLTPVAAGLGVDTTGMMYQIFKNAQISLVRVP